MHGSPPFVRVWFNEKLKPVLSKLVVKNSQGKKVSDASRVDTETQQTILCSVPALPPGKYHVYWEVVALDGHPSKGDYIFTIVF